MNKPLITLEQLLELMDSNLNRNECKRIILDQLHISFYKNYKGYNFDICSGGGWYVTYLFDLKSSNLNKLRQQVTLQFETIKDVIYREHLKILLKN